MLWVHREDFIAYAVTLVLWLAAFVGYSWSVFGTVIPPYYMASRLQFHEIVLPLAVNLISPGCGLLAFVPITLFVLYIAARYRKQLAYRGLAVFAFAQIVALAIAVSTNKSWTAGWSYGPRCFTDAIPWFVLLAILGLDAMRRAPGASRHMLEIAWAIFLLAVSVAVNARGAWSFAGMDWNPVEQHGMFDWRYPQFMAGLIKPPKD